MFVEQLSESSPQEIMRIHNGPNEFHGFPHECRTPLSSQLYLRSYIRNQTLLVP
jgi:hypothetical protein